MRKYMHDLLLGAAVTAGMVAVIACAKMQETADQGCPVVKALAAGCDFVLLEGPDGGRVKMRLVRPDAGADQ